jgi:hypothetical protein
MRDARSASGGAAEDAYGSYVPGLWLPAASVAVSTGAICHDQEVMTPCAAFAQAVDSVLRIARWLVW